ncbi:Protein slowmo [Armadillidium nasatum]|uniref:Protein slowmo n=1 Tax=Armadillidium nasatum TaxID=96803 RepID=A0A5N5SX91_9CRUS|nr:Protein slowmo [Armadillidium nasatum]
MKIWTTEHVFNHPWETVVQAVWRKYPNPHKPEVLSTDIVDRKVEKGILYSTRFISSRWGLPGWAKKLIGSDGMCYAFENSEVDPVKQKMKMRTRNVSFANTVSMDERMEYKPDPNDASKTIVHQEMFIAVRGVPLTSYIENYLINYASNNSSKGKDAMEWIIKKIDVEVEELMHTYKRGTSELKTSIGKFQDTAKKSIGDISNLTKSNKTLPRI